MTIWQNGTGPWTTLGVALSQRLEANTTEVEFFPSFWLVELYCYSKFGEFPGCLVVRTHTLLGPWFNPWSEKGDPRTFFQGDPGVGMLWLLLIYFPFILMDSLVQLLMITDVNPLSKQKGR